MVRKVETIVTLLDDLDGAKADRTVRFAVDGRSYEIDLSRKNAAAFEKVLKPYLDAARQVRATSGRTRPVSSRATDKQRLQAIREWAAGQGIEISPRGRIPNTVVEAYDSAH